MDGSGVNRVSGGADLKGSQHYPKLFGKAVAELYQQNREGIVQDVTHQLNLVYNQGVVLLSHGRSKNES